MDASIMRMCSPDGSLTAAHATAYVNCFTVPSKFTGL